ncbi:MAG: class II aldolase/adducin family protein, partial [Novosphingobium sp.]
MAAHQADRSVDPVTAERQARRDLAAAFRLAAHFGWDDGIATHMSARLPDGTFLLNPF